MRLLSATVRDYRIHRELSVQFDPSRTLVGGPNESGKSTLIEAIHRALFLKATVTGEALAAMQSKARGGPPEVEVRFEARGAEYLLAKRFSGQSGTAKLSQVGGQTWQGEQAESRLATLLGVEEAGGGRGILDRVRGQWAHLWVWQGESMADPAAHMQQQQTGLLKRLQEVGGAVAMQSDLDARVAAEFAEARALIYGKGTTPLKNSRLGAAQEELKAAESEHGQAVERLERLRQAVEGHEEAAGTIARVEKELGEIQRQQKEVGERIARVDELRALETTQAVSFDSAAEKLAVLESAESTIGDLTASVEALERSVAPLQEAQAGRQAAFETGKTRKEVSEAAYDRALDITRQARAREGLAAAHVGRFDKQARAAVLTTRWEHVQQLETALNDLRAEIAGLAPLDQQGLERLSSLENQLAREGAALDAMATEVEVVSAALPVKMGEGDLDPGQSRTVSAPTDIVVGDAVHLRIRPGGGDSLAQARERVRTLQMELRRSLDALGLASVATATEVMARRVDLEARVREAEAGLHQWKPSELAEDRKNTEAELAAATAEVERRVAQAPDMAAPATLEEARAQQRAAEAALQTAESDEERLRTERDTLRAQLTGLEEALAESRTRIDDERQKLNEGRAQLNLLVEQRGDGTVRAKALEDARSHKARLEGELVSTRRALEGLQPELLAADRDRLQRARTEAERQRQEATNRLAVCTHLLRSDGSDDPTDRLAQAQARLEAATEHLRSVGRKAEAIDLVDHLFQGAQKELAAEFSKPLADKIGAYAQCLFGAEATPDVGFENNVFTAVKLARSAGTGAFEFGELSGGAREQVAAAVRLAIAELLAADHDGTLPVVFDDAFAYSDPERVNTLQRMLDLAATRGLQVIVLTCNPSDYAALGARQVLLARPAVP